MKENYSIKTAKYLETFVGKEGFRLIKTEFVNEDGNWYLRAYIDLTDEERAKRKAEKAAQAEDAEKAAEAGTAEEKSFSEEDEDPAVSEEPGIGINDCAMVSRRLSKWLDQEDFIDEIYTLEVCSPGYLSESNESVQ